MADKEIIIKATDYRYPTRDERKQVYDSEPLLRNFGFERVSTLFAVLNESKNAAETHKQNILYWWDFCLQFRIRNLSESYLNSLVHFERGIPDDLTKFEDHHYINRMQFDYYAESYYYLFSTVRDNIGQILNVYYSLKIEENKIHFNKAFAGNIPDPAAQRILQTFMDKTEQNTLYRNSFTHRYMPSHPDNREHFQENNGHAIFYSPRGEFVTTTQFRDNIVESQKELAALINDLRVLIVR